MTQNGRSCSVLFLATVLALSVLEGEPPVDAQGRGTLSGIVTHVANGDTLDITANGRTYTIRLDGIDAPEGGRRRLPSGIAIATAGQLPASSSLGVISARRWSGRDLRGTSSATLPTGGLPRLNRKPGSNVVGCGPIEPRCRPGSIGAIVGPLRT